MAGRGPAPKPAHLRQRRNRKPVSARLVAPQQLHDAPIIPNPDGREWHPLTLAAWEHAWSSPMASQWLQTDADALGRLAVLWDAYYRSPKTMTLAEIRLQEQRFGLSPLDRSRLQWDVTRAGGGERRQSRSARLATTTKADPRAILMAVK
jgi:hypothetical protein